MKLIRFTASGVHGYLKFDIKFKKDLNLLTGINGSGKTTALNAIVALITPDLAVLSNLEFSNLKINFENEGRNFTVSAESKNDSVELYCLKISCQPRFVYPA